MNESTDAPQGAGGAPRDEGELEERLSRPTPAVRESLSRVRGDVVVLGAGGKMGPSLTAMLRRALDASGDRRTVYAVSRWGGDGGARDAARLSAMGIRVITGDLTDHAALAALPDAPNVIFMAGQKFGTTGDPSLTWMTNTVVPALVADRYRDARVVAFSTGNVYPRTPASSSGSREDDALAPAGDYGASCVGRERVLEWASRHRGTRVAIVRLNYAVDLRYGVLVDLARKIVDGTPIDLAMGYVNCIWQGDANASAIRLLEHAESPPLVVNITGTERLAVREVARALGRRLAKEPRFSGEEAADALLSDTTRAQSLLGAPVVDAKTLVSWVAEWVAAGGRTLGKATRFEERAGRY